MKPCSSFKARGSKLRVRKSRYTQKHVSRILIVCEGKCTEYLYFLSLVQKERLSNSVNVVGIGGEPGLLFKQALKIYEQSEGAQNSYNKVYCVFDKDDHACFDEVVKTIKQDTRGIFKCIVSVPCFEFFLLLHFTYTSKPFESTGGRTGAELVTRELEKYVQNYSKSNKKIISSIEDKVKEAVKNCKKLEKEGVKSPYTNAHELVLDLIEHLKDVTGEQE